MASRLPECASGVLRFPSHSTAAQVTHNPNMHRLHFAPVLMVDRSASGVPNLGAGSVDVLELPES